MTDVGRRILGGEADRIVLRGIERWIGGVRLSGHRVGWRWDGRTGKLVPSAG